MAVQTSTECAVKLVPINESDEMELTPIFKHVDMVVYWRRVRAKVKRGGQAAHGRKIGSLLNYIIPFAQYNY